MIALPSALIRCLHRWTLWGSVLAFLLCGLVGSGLMLCIGPDGHVAVESVGAQPHPAGSQIELATDCLDRPVVEPAGPSSRADGGPVPPLVALLCLLWPLLVWRRPVGHPPRPRTGPDPRLVHHRTVLLLN